MKLRMHLATLAAVCAAAALPATAMAEDGAPASAGGYVVGFQVVSVDATAGTATGTLHCVSGELAGRQVTLPLAPGLDTSALTAGAMVGVRVDGGKIAATQAAPCDAQLATPQPPAETEPAGDAPAPGHGGKGPGDGHGRGKGNGNGQFLPGFQNRVWRFVGEANGFANGQLSITLGQILNLPKRFASQDDSLVDQDATVLVGDRTRIRDKDGTPAPTSDLDSANDVRVEGKLLPPRKWVTDQDGQPVPTIRAKRIVILD